VQATSFFRPTNVWLMGAIVSWQLVLHVLGSRFLKTRPYPWPVSISDLTYGRLDVSLDWHGARADGLVSRHHTSGAWSVQFLSSQRLGLKHY